MEAVEGGVWQMWMTGDGLQWHLYFVEQGVGLRTADGSRRAYLCPKHVWHRERPTVTPKLC